MQTTNFVDTLIPSLLTRAQAYKQMPRMAFKDKAAELLVEKLDLKDCGQFIGVESPSDRNIALARCVWIDHCALQFIEQYPQAVGINLSCGLNTRFHRLSQQLDWPRFRWADIDTPETIAFNRGLLPSIDNYRAIGCDYWREDWLQKTGWKPNTPIIVVLEKLAFTAPQKQLYALFQYLQNIVNANPKTRVDIILDFPNTEPPNLLTQFNKWLFASKTTTDSVKFTSVENLIQQLGINASCIRAKELSPVVHRGKKSGFIPWFYRLLTNHTYWTGVQLSLQAKNTKRS